MVKVLRPKRCDDIDGPREIGSGRRAPATEDTAPESGEESDEESGEESGEESAEESNEDEDRECNSMRGVFEKSV